ncbi:MAG: FAD-binding oxidoreductase [Flavobacterium sp.]|nr:MAG: FAD-binding oxidoreductase [Flavobacterium sp.]
MIDYLIVGSGLAGIAFAEQALQNGKSIVVFDNGALQSSRVAGGLYNPVVLKRFNGVWDASGQLEAMEEFYASVEQKLNKQFHFPMPILRKFHSIEEQNNWFTASDKPGLAPFLSTKLISKKYNHIDSPFDFGEVLHAGYADTKSLLESYHQYLSDNQLLITETFVHESLIASENIEYRGLDAKHIVFAEGFGIQANQYFSHLPLEGTKGELFIIKAIGLNLDSIIKSGVFIVPLGNDFYKVGATYEWNDKTETPTEKGKASLIEMIRETLNCDFEIISHRAGIRPTVKDRKPLLGTHPNHKNIHVLNGMGTRGVMLAPKMAKMLFEHIEFSSALAPEVDIKRFSV